MSTGCVSDMVFVDVPKTGTGSASNWLLISSITIISSAAAATVSRLRDGRSRFVACRVLASTIRHDYLLLTMAVINILKHLCQ